MKFTAIKLLLLLIAVPETAFSGDWSCSVDISICDSLNVSCSNGTDGPMCLCTQLDASVHPVAYDNMVNLNPACKDPNDLADQTPVGVGSIGKVTDTKGTSAAVGSFTRAITATDNPVVTTVLNKAESADGQQTSSLVAANEVNQIGSNQVATVGALFCAQGANANLTNTADAAAYYANCQQNFTAAKLMNPSGAFNPDTATIENAAAKQALEDFDKNFGVPPADFLSHMLGQGGGGGTAALSSLLGDKIPSAKLSAALEAAGQITPSDLAKNPNQFVVDLAAGKGGHAGNSLALRDALKKKLASPDTEDRNPASEGKSDKKFRGPEKYESLTPATDGIFAQEEQQSELTIFDVVHLR
ncbi:MAG: hypothetical protein ACXWP1_08100, partial [Bdellovibrionota bacterium]